jgi:serine/threonine protein kinase
MPQLKLENSLVDERYEVRERLSLGSYAEIFVARDRRSTGQEVVIKALNTHLQGTPEADLEKTLIENFQNEAVALDAVRHPHIILRLGHGTAADLNGVPFHYLVLEYLPGGDLLKLCKSRPGNALDLQGALFYFKQVCEGLAYAHSKGVIHRDLKPNNFLLSRDQSLLKVADFGVAKITTEETAEITRVGADIYAPPEHHPDESRGHIGRLTAAADIYSMAKSFYTLLTGRAPAQFNRRPITALPEAINQQPWAGSLLRVLQRATAEKPTDRYATVIEFWSELANVAAQTQPTTSFVAVEDEATRVRPKELSQELSKELPQEIKDELKVAPSNLPATPEQPDFVSLLETAPAKLAASTPTTPPAVAERRKIVVNFDLPKAEPPAVVANAEPAKPSPPKQPRVQPTAEAPMESFMAPMWRRVAVALLAVLFLATLVSVYRYAREKRTNPPAANNPTTPTSKIFGEQLEVIADGLTVRSGPGSSFEKLGEITQNSKHKVLSKNANGWVQIEVSEWSPNYPAAAQKQGWVNGSAKFVTITARSWF